MTVYKEKALIIFSGSNQRAVLAFCRFAKEYDIHFFIIANGKNDTIFETDYVQHVIFVREENVINVDMIIRIKKLVNNSKGLDRIFILPSTEFINRFLLDKKNVLSAEGIEFGLCDLKTYSLFSDKITFAEICKNKDICVPREYSSPPSDRSFVVKPRKYIDDDNNICRKPIIIYENFQHYIIDKINNIENYFFQEYITGNSYYLLYYFSVSGDYAVYSQKNLIQQAGGGSIILARSSGIHKSEAESKFAEVFIEQGFHGLVMVEVREKNGEWYMIEANPRLWGPSQLILDSDMDLFEKFALENELTARKKPHFYKNGVYYYWQGGLIKDMKSTKNPNYYGYSLLEYMKDLPLLMDNEVYLKNDSYKIYMNESRSRKAFRAI